MGRRKDEAPEIGDNLSDEEREKAWLLYYFKQANDQKVLRDRAKATAKAESDKYTEIMRSAKADAKIQRDELESYITDGLLGEKTLSLREERRARHKQWLGQPVGTQGDLLAGIPLEMQDEAHAKAVGYEMGLRGEPCEMPDTLQPRFAKVFAEGWHKGQEELAWALSAVGKIVDRRKDASARPVALEPEPDDDEGQLDVETEARKLAGSGWTEPTTEEAAFA